MQTLGAHTGGMRWDWALGDGDIFSDLLAKDGQHMFVSVLQVNPGPHCPFTHGPTGIKPFWHAAKVKTKLKWDFAKITLQNHQRKNRECNTDHRIMRDRENHYLGCNKDYWPNYTQNQGRTGH